MVTHNTFIRLTVALALLAGVDTGSTAYAASAAGDISGVGTAVVTPSNTPQVAGALPNLSAIAANTALDLGDYTCTQMAGDAPCWHIQDYSRFNYDPYNHQMLAFG